MDLDVDAVVDDGLNDGPDLALEAVPVAGGIGRGVDVGLAGALR